MIFHPRKEPIVPDDTENRYLICFRVEANVEICSFLHKASKQAPTLLFFHGNGEIAQDYHDLAPEFQKRGINFCVVDYRGYGQSGGEPTFAHMLEDSHPIFHQFKEYLTVNGYTGPLSVMGRSLGSASAIELASTYTEDITSIIIESGFAYTYELLQRLGVPKKFLPEDKELQISPLPLMNEISKPTLIIHGEADFIIPANNGYALYENCTSVDKKLVIIPNAGHNDLLYLGFDKYMGAVESFLVH